MEITLSTDCDGIWTHVWPSHDGLKLMWYRSACRLHLPRAHTRRVYNFCNMSKVNEWMKKSDDNRNDGGGGVGGGCDGVSGVNNTIQNALKMSVFHSIHFFRLLLSPLSLHPHHWQWCDMVTLCVRHANGCCCCRCCFFVFSSCHTVCIDSR